MTHRELLGALTRALRHRGGVARGGVALLLRVATALLELGESLIQRRGLLLRRLLLGRRLLGRGRDRGDDTTSVAAFGRGRLSGFACAGHA